MSVAAEWARLAPACCCCGVVQVLEYGRDFAGRVWCLDCALVEDAARRRRKTAGRSLGG